MSKIPRDINGKDLSKKLKKYGYTITRQTGSHIRLSSNYMGYEHHITIPEHNPLKIRYVERNFSGNFILLEDR